MGTTLGFTYAKKRRHFLKQVLDEKGEPVKDTYICVTCENERK